MSAFLGCGKYSIPTDCQLAIRFPIPGDPKSIENADEYLTKKWHVDDIFDNFLPPFSLLVGIPLNDWTEDWNGNLAVFRGSHKIVNELIREDYSGFCQRYQMKAHPRLNHSDQVRVGGGVVRRRGIKRDEGSADEKRMRKYVNVY